MKLQLFYTKHNAKCFALLPHVPDWVEKIDAYMSTYDPPLVPLWRIVDDEDNEVATLESTDLQEVKLWFRAYDTPNDWQRLCRECHIALRDEEDDL